MGKETPYDKVNSSLKYQSILITAFAYLAVGDLTQIFKILPIFIGVSKFFPLAICLVGIAYSIYSVFCTTEVVFLKDLVYQATPVIFGVGWVTLLSAFSLEAFGLV